MKHTMKRSLSLVLALCMVLGLVVLPGVTEAKAEGESLLSTPLKSSAMDVLSGYYPQGWKQSANKGAASLSSIQTDDGEDARTFYQMKVDKGVTKEAFACWKWEESTFTDKTLVLRYDVMVDASSAEATLYLPTFSNSESGRLITLNVVNNVLTYGTNTKVLAQNRWYEIEITFSGTNNMTIYVDGEHFAYAANLYGVRKATTINYVHMAIAVPGANVAMNIDNMAVYDFVDGAAISAAQDTYAVGMNETISNIWSKTAGAYLPSVKYTSSNEDVAKVDANGVVTGVGIGEAVITATPAASTGMKAVSVTVTVENSNDPISKPEYSHGMDELAPDSTSSIAYENYYPSGWLYSNQYNNINASTIVTDGENRYYHMQASADHSTRDFLAYKAVSVGRNAVLKYRLMVDNSDLATAWEVAIPCFAIQYGGRGTQLSIVPTGTAGVYSLTDGTNTWAWTEGRWYDVEMVVSNEGKAWSLWIDGTKVLNGTKGASYAITNAYINMGLMRTKQNGASLNVDDLEVYTYVANGSITAAQNSYSVAVGSKVLPVWTKTDGAYLPSVKYTSSNKAIATVDENGVVTGLKDGTVTITATPSASSGMKPATTTVVVGTGEEQRPELKFSTAAPVLENNLAILFKADASLFTTDGYSNPSATFQFNGETYEVSDYTVEGDKYVFKFSGIAPHQMGDEITYTLNATYDGEEVSSQAKTYSILTYCNYYLTSTNESLKTLLVDTLNYGAAAQNYKGYKTDALVNAALSEEQKNFKAPELENKTTQNGEATVASWTNAALVLDNAITVRLKFSTEADISGLTVKVNGAEVAIAGTANNYYVDYNGLDAGQLRDDITAEIYQGDTLVSKTLTFSAEYYAAYQAQSSTDANLVALVKAMMKYGDSAAAFENN